VNSTTRHADLQAPPLPTAHTLAPRASEGGVVPVSDCPRCISCAGDSQSSVEPHDGSIRGILSRAGATRERRKGRVAAFFPRHRNALRRPDASSRYVVIDRARVRDDYDAKPKSGRSPAEVPLPNRTDIRTVDRARRHLARSSLTTPERTRRGQLRATSSGASGDPQSRESTFFDVRSAPA
jgi:hypothetical protein